MARRIARRRFSGHADRPAWLAYRTRSGSRAGLRRLLLSLIETAFLAGIQCGGSHDLPLAVALLASSQAGH
jgi:hypothetical protein